MRVERGVVLKVEHQLFFGGIKLLFKEAPAMPNNSVRREAGRNTLTGSTMLRS
jgi:hypothetical protein